MTSLPAVLISTVANGHKKLLAENLFWRIKMNKYEQLSHERKQLQLENLAPDWLTTAGYQLLKGKSYLNTAETPSDMYDRIAKRAAELTKFRIPDDFGYDSWYDAFMSTMWMGWLSPSTPVLTNMGNDRGHPISCSGTYLGDSIRSFYQARTEIAQLTQRGYGTSTCVDPVRHRGAPISKGGTANGIMQPASGIVDDMDEITQGTSRRGSCGIYMNPLHQDFDELADQLIANNEGWNIGWNITDEFDALFEKDFKRADHLWKRMLKVKAMTGKGYYLFLDKVNRHRPEVYKRLGFYIRHSNLCAEILLMSDKDHSFTCVLSSVNAAKYDEWKDTKLIQIATVFLDAVIEDMLIKAKEEPGFERIIAFTEKSRAQGLGILGEATYYQQKMWVFGDFQSIQFNQMLLKTMNQETLVASRLLAEKLGEPEWMKGTGERMSHRLALPPTKSTSVIQGGVSEGINPVFANVYEQDTAGGTVYRINPVLLKLMKERDQYTVETMTRIAEDQGSVQGEGWLTDHEKAVLRTSFEINQETILLMASHRQQIMAEGGGGQGQSVNLFFTADESEEEIARIHDIAFRDPWIFSLYYIYSLNKSMKHQIDKTACEACEG
jgi:ribonucleoside-diphosphate reductase alpha chain